MARAHDAPAADEPTATPPPTREDATALLLAGLALMRPRLSHAYGCPSESGGPCPCGYQDVVTGMDALTTPPPP